MYILSNYMVGTTSDAIHSIYITITWILHDIFIKLHDFTWFYITWCMQLLYMIITIFLHEIYITLHEVSIYYMFCTAYLECTFLLHVFYIVYMHYQHILHDYYMYYMIITWIFHVSFWLQKNDPSLFCSQPAWSIFTRTLALGHLRGWLLHFILYWE